MSEKETLEEQKANLIKKKLYDYKVEARTIYPYPIHRMKAYEKIIHNKLKLKESEKAANEIFSLPLYPELKSIEINYICKSLIKVLDKI